MTSLVDLRLRPAASQATSATSRRRIARSLGAATGVLLGLAFLPLAVANADDYDIDPTGTETITGLYGTGFAGADTAPPAVAGTFQGFQTFDYTDTTTSATGSFSGDEATVTDGFDDTNMEVLVTSDTAGSTDAPPVGSVFDTYTFDDGSDENIYSAIPSATGGDTISDTLVTQYGDYTIPTTFDAANVSVADATGVPFDGDDFLPVADSEKIISTTAIPPLTMAVQGDEMFDLDNAAGNLTGSFAADETTTADGDGTYTEEVLVTQDLSGTDDPPVGSIFNTVNFDGYENIYSDIPSTTGGAATITDTVVTPFGDFSLPETFDLTAAEVPVSVDLPDGDDIVADPSSPEVFTGINGLPPVDVGVQADREFDLDSSTGTVLGTFDAEETKTVDLFGDTTQALLVTSDGTTGADPGDLMPVGSVIETVSLGAGFENIYTDLASTTGADTASDTLVTPFGDFTVPVTFDAAADLAADLFKFF
ncbi:MAG: hypothetical protein WB777_18130 [Mycobacterium sp.]